MLTDAVRPIVGGDQESANLVVVARLAAELRDYAGQLGAAFAEALVTGRELDESDANKVSIAQGRIYQLRDFLLARTGATPNAPQLQEAVERVKHEYLDTALELAVELRSLPAWKGKPPLTPMQFVDMYVPGMKSITMLRDNAYQLALEDVDARRRSLAVDAVLALVAGVAGEVLAIWVVLRLRGRYVLRLAQLSSTLALLQAERPGSYGREEALSELTHDMKSPQAGIIALLELARSTEAYQSNPELFFRIEGYARRTLKMVDDFVQMSQTHSVAQEMMETDLHGALLDACDNLSALARAKQITLEVADTDGEPYTVFGDAELIVRAVTNVVENAIKYSPPEASVHCSLQREPRWTRLHVKDTGYGMRAEDVPHVFERYRRFRTPGQPRIAGTGLGLAFVKEQVTRMRGKVSCHSVLGAGTEFVLRFPKKRSWLERIRLWLATRSDARQA